MKKVTFSALLFLSALYTKAQVTEGKIIYERKVNMHRRMTDESMKNMVPEFSTNKAQLLFSGDESLFKDLPEEQDVRDNAGNDDNRVIVKIGGGDNETYKNFALEKLIELRELGPKKYIIEDTLHKTGWKLEEETKTIIGHVCKKATGKSAQGSSLVAWYAEDIQTSSGPEQFGGLPGAILELNVNDAEIVFTALQVETKDFNKSMVKAPTGAKKITRKEFQKMMDDQFGSNPGGGPVIRIIRDDIHN